MSLAFDGVVVTSSDSRVKETFEALRSSLALAIGRVAAGVFVVYPTGGRRTFDVEEDKRIAAHLSESLGKALLVLWDDRVDCDHAFLFADGLMENEFGSSNERYVLLDENGEPQTDGRQFRLEELSEDEEYNCVRHAIDAGLDALGVAERVSLGTLMLAFHEFE